LRKYWRNFMKIAGAYDCTKINLIF
jgi:hypothetical protein